MFRSKLPVHTRTPCDSLTEMPTNPVLLTMVQTSDSDDFLSMKDHVTIDADFEEGIKASLELPRPPSPHEQPALVLSNDH